MRSSIVLSAAAVFTSVVSDVNGMLAPYGSRARSLSPVEELVRELPNELELMPRADASTGVAKRPKLKHPPVFRTRRRGVQNP